MSGGDGFQDDDDVDVDGSYHDNDGEDDHNDDHDDDHDGELVKIEISGSGWRDPDEVVWPAAMHIENTHMHSADCQLPPVAVSSPLVLLTISWTFLLILS